MIYMHGEDGSVCEYTEKSGIKYIMSYTCGSVMKGGVFEDLKPYKHIHLASYSESHLDFLTERYEICASVHRVIGRDGKSYNWHSRCCTEIDWNKDYHFYEDRDTEVIE